MSPFLVLGMSDRCYHFSCVLNKKNRCSAMFFFFDDFDERKTIADCSMADGISFEVSLSLNCTDLYKREGGA